MQFIDIIYQLKIVAYSLLFGCFLCFVYDIIKIVRMLLFGEGRINGFASALSAVFLQITDFIYMLFGGVSFSIFLYYFNSGRFRWYLLLGTVLGYLICRYSFSFVICKLLFFLIVFLKKALIHLILLITGPLLKVLNLLWSPIKKRIELKKTKKFTEREKKRIINLLEYKG